MRLSHLVFVTVILTVTTIASAQYTIPGYQPTTPDFPYIAEITGDNVYIRSGAGTHHYDCLKLNKGDRVKIVGIKNNWARIAPPVESFSWVSQRYINVDPNTPNIGTVIAEPVIVRAGSADGSPLHSEAEQTSLKRSEKVIILDTYGTDYYKIAPPQGVYLWVSVQFTRPLVQAENIPAPIEELPVMTPEYQPEYLLPTDINSTDSNAAVVVPTTISAETKMIEQYRQLEQLLTAEKAKAPNQQDYSQLKQKFQAIAEDKTAGKAVRYAEFAIKQIERYELALNIAQETKLQDQQFEKIMENVENARQAKLAQIQQLGKYAAVGNFTLSAIYGRNHYQIVDQAGKITCFALPAQQAANINCNDYLGKRVGLVGIITPHQPTSKALVTFSEIKILE